MKRLQIGLGSFASVEWLSEQASSYSRVLWLLPTSSLIDERTLRGCPDIYYHKTTIDGLQDRLWRGYLGGAGAKASPLSGRSLIGHEKQTVVLYSAVRALVASGEISYLQQLGQSYRPTLLHEILMVFKQLVDSCFEDSMIDHLATKLERFSLDDSEERYLLDRELILLYGEYEEQKVALEVYDQLDLDIEISRLVATASELPALGGVDLIIWDQLFFLTRRQEDFLAQLYRFCDNVLWLWDLPVPVNPDQDWEAYLAAQVGQELYRDWLSPHFQAEPRSGQHRAFRFQTSLFALYQRLARGKEAPVVTFHPLLSATPALIGDYLYGSNTPDWAALEQDFPQSGFHLEGFANRAAEVRAIAAKIKQIVAEQGDDLGAIRVFVPDLTDYLLLVYEIFPLYGVPFNVTKGLPLEGTPLAEFMLRVLDLLLSGFRAADLHYIFTSPFLKLPPLELSEPQAELSQLLAQLPGCDSNHYLQLLLATNKKLDQLEIDTLDRVARSAGVDRESPLTDPLAGWVERLWRYRQSSLLSELDFVLAVNQVRIVCCYLKLLVDQINGAGVSLLPIITSWVNPYAILDGLGDVPHLSYRERRFLVRRDQLCLQKLALIAKVASDDSRFYQEHGSDLSWGQLRFYRHSLSTQIRRTTISEAGSPNAVQVSEFMEVRGRSFDYIFIAGLSANAIDRQVPSGLFMPRSPSGCLRVKNGQDQSRYLIYKLLLAYRRNCYLSYPEAVGTKRIWPAELVGELSYLAQRINAALPWSVAGAFTAPYQLLRAPLVQAQYRAASDPYGLLPVIVAPDQAENLVYIYSYLRAQQANLASTPYHGVIGRTVDLGKSAISITSLEQLARCPQRFYWQGQLQLSPLPDAPESLRADIRGSLIHKVLEQLFTRVESTKKAISELDKQLLYRWADQALNQVLAQFEPHNLAVDLEIKALRQELGGGLLGGSSRPGILALLICWEQSRVGQVLQLEQSFGREEPITMGPFSVVGRIDRVDAVRNAHGQRAIMVYDYKTGSNKPQQLLESGVSFQPLGYLAAAKKQWPQCAEFGFAHITLKELSADPGASPLQNELYYGDRDHSLDQHCLPDYFAGKLLRLAQSGHFPWAGGAASCEYCEYRYACYRDGAKLRTQVYDYEEHQQLWKDVADLLATVASALKAGGEKRKKDSPNPCELVARLDENRLYLRPSYYQQTRAKLLAMEAG